MAGYLKVQVEKFEVQSINLMVNAEILNDFQRKLKQQNLMMNTVLTAFCRQYVKGSYVLNETDILRWENDNDETRMLNTTVDKEVYTKFKSKVKGEGYFLRYVLSAFIEDYNKNNLYLEFVRE